MINSAPQGGVPASSIGVIATYRAQVAQISQYLEEMSVEVSTVDQFQGRDKNVVIYSCTKSADGAKGSKDTSRVNKLKTSLVFNFFVYFVVRNIRGQKTFDCCHHASQTQTVNSR